MTNFGVEQVRKISLDSSMLNEPSTGQYLQGNNRYIIDLELTDNSVPANIPTGADLLCTPNGSPLFYSSIVYNKLEPIDQRIIDLINKK